MAGGPGDNPKKVASPSAAGRTDELIQAVLLGEAVDDAPAAVFVFDEAGRYVAVNRYACELLGYAREELLTMRIGDLAVGAREDALRHYVDVVAGRAPEGVARARRSDGRELEFRFRARKTQVGGQIFFVAIAWE